VRRALHAHRGSTFAVYLPSVAGPAEDRRAAPPPTAPRRGTETVLLVEDEAAVRAIARETLVRHGYTVLVAEDGPSGLEVARAHDGDIALLLTDVVMPGMNGRVLAELLTRERPETAVLFMSGYTEDEVLHRGVEGERMAFMSKPFTPLALAARVRELLDGAAVTA
jgi:two-component system, cell cycle sensor histidine kinase and response regulator CckA